MKTVLIVDDDNDDVDIFREALSMIDPGIVCHCADNGQVLFEKMDNKEFEIPSVIFLDINMPEMNGWDSLSKLKDSDIYRHVPVIMYTTSDATQDAARALRLGASCFFTKPIYFDQLKNFLTVVVDNLDGNLISAVKNYDGLKSHKVFTCA